MEIPLDCLITVEMGKETEVGRAVMEADLELDAPKHVFLMLFLLTDRKNKDSRFQPYYAMLPATLSNMPVFWRADELEKLQGSFLLTQIEERNLAIAKDYESICKIYSDFENIATLDEFRWARMCVCSRNFGIVIDGIRTSALVPYADMLNHLRPRETKWTFDNARSAFTITALQYIEKGDQIYDSYGQKCNHRFLLNYGFAIEDNREADGFNPNEIAFDIALRQDDPLTPRKQLLWIRDGSPSGSGPKRIRICASDNDNFRAVLSLLRVCVADDDDLERLFGQQNPYGAFRTASDIHFPLSFRNELRVLRLLGQSITNMLNKYPTSLEQDLQDLKGNTLPPFSNQRHAKIHVKSEKVVLRHYIAFAAIALDLARIPLGEHFDQALTDLFDGRWCAPSPSSSTNSDAWRSAFSFQPTRGDCKHVASYCNSVLRQVKRLAGPHDDVDACLDSPTSSTLTTRRPIQVANIERTSNNGQPSDTSSTGKSEIDLKAPTIV
uniref:Rubisco LSMT substrate-binding domain-containing protein n=1 Tax=Aureoumbra lagunensis TaxID=44058 RepID=A0A7S3JSP0_9STRA